MRMILCLILVTLLLTVGGCQSTPANDSVSESVVAPAVPSVEPSHFFTEQELVTQIKNLDENIDCFYRLVTVPAALEFDSYTVRANYIDWWYRISSIDKTTTSDIGTGGYIYLRWRLGDGQTWLDNDQNAAAMGITEIQAGERTYEYYIGDTANPRLYGIRWLQDGYLFEISIPEDFITINGNLDDVLLLKYTELIMVVIENNNGEQSEQFNDPSDNNTAEISVGSVSLVVGEREYEAHTQVVFGRNNGVSFDALIEQPQEVAGKLEKIVFEEGMQLVIDGGNRWGNRTFLLYRLIDGEWLRVFERQEGLSFGVETVFEDPPGFLATQMEQGDYILGVRLAWQNGLEGVNLKYTGYQYTYRLVIGETTSSLDTLLLSQSI